jgi:hypothetical protein
MARPADSPHVANRNGGQKQPSSACEIYLDPVNGFDRGVDGEVLPDLAFGNRCQ